MIPQEFWRLGGRISVVAIRPFPHWAGAFSATDWPDTLPRTQPVVAAKPVAGNGPPWDLCQGATLPAAIVDLKRWTSIFVYHRRLFMGLKTSYLQFIESSVEQAFGKRSAKGLRMLELGDQVMVEPQIAEKTGKEYFVNRGYEHVSVDINGLHGAVVRDLTKPEQFHDWNGSWDIVTNSGTTEHVEPFESQYECFSILHNCMRVGGISVHLIPDVHERDVHGLWKDHCRFYYSEAFFEFLAQECGYEILSNTVIEGLRCATVRKTNNAVFTGDRDKFLAMIAQRQYRPNHLQRVARNVLRRMGVARLLRLLGLR
jgi:hypothetical protein